jgi:hypothetical protein
MEFTIKVETVWLINADTEAQAIAEALDATLQAKRSDFDTTILAALDFENMKHLED